MEEIRWLPTIVATVISMGVGALWYSNVLFLPAWKRAAGREPTRQPIAYVISAIAALAGAFIVGSTVGPGSTVTHAIFVGVALGLLVATLSLAVNYSFAERQPGLLAIDGGFHTVRFTVMALVFALWPMAF